MSRGSHIECPTCRGSLGVEEGVRVTTCGFCQTPLLVEAPGVMPRYAILPRVDKDGARRSLQRALLSPDIPRGFLAASSLKSCELAFVPFHELDAKRVGTLRERSLERQTQRPTVDTHVVLGDVSLSSPALELPGWGLSQVSLSRTRQEHLAAFVPFNRRSLNSCGRVLPPRLAPETLWRSHDAATRQASDGTTLEHRRVKLVFYPVWRLRFLHRGRLYSASVDGMTGTCLFLRVPQSAASRVGWLLASSLAVGVIAGGIARFVLAVTERMGGEALVAAALAVIGLGPWMLVPAGFLGVVLLLVVELGYEQFRYPGEVVIEAGKVEIVKLGKVRPLLADKLSAALESILRRIEDRRS